MVLVRVFNKIPFCQGDGQLLIPVGHRHHKGATSCYPCPWTWIHICCRTERELGSRSSSNEHLRTRCCERPFSEVIPHIYCVPQCSSRQCSILVVCGRARQGGRIQVKFMTMFAFIPVTKEHFEAWAAKRVLSKVQLRVRGPSIMKPFFIRYDNRIAHMITKTAQAQDQLPISLQANYQMF